MPRLKRRAHKIRANNILQAGNLAEARRLAPAATDRELQEAIREALKMSPSGPGHWHRWVILSVCREEQSRRMSPAERAALIVKWTEEALKHIEGRAPGPRRIQ